MTRYRKAKKPEEAMDVKSRFLSMVSHEFRTPLAAIKEGIAIVADGTAGSLNKEQSGFLDIAKRNVDRLTCLINDVLDYQALEAGHLEFNMEKADINEAIREVAGKMAPLIEEKGGIESNLSPHSLRHTVGTRLLK